MKAQSDIRSGGDLHLGQNHRHLTIEVAKEVKTSKIRRKAIIITRIVRIQPKRRSRTGMREDVVAAVAKTASVVKRRSSRARAKALRSSRSRSQVESTNAGEPVTTTNQGLRSELVKVR